MKHLLVIVIGLFCTSIVTAQGPYTKTVKTASEIKSENVVNKLSQALVLSDTQKRILLETTTIYLDGIAELNAQNGTAEQRKELDTQRDKRVKEVLANDAEMAEYQKSVNELFAKPNTGQRR